MALNLVQERDSQIKTGSLLEYCTKKKINVSVYRGPVGLLPGTPGTTPEAHLNGLRFRNNPRNAKMDKVPVFSFSY